MAKLMVRSKESLHETRPVTRLRITKSQKVYYNSLFNKKIKERRTVLLLSGYHFFVNHLNVVLLFNFNDVGNKAVITVHK